MRLCGHFVCKIVQKSNWFSFFFSLLKRAYSDEIKYFVIIWISFESIDSHRTIAINKMHIRQSNHFVLIVAVAIRISKRTSSHEKKNVCALPLRCHTEWTIISLLNLFNLWVTHTTSTLTLAHTIKLLTISRLLRIRF